MTFVGLDGFRDGWVAVSISRRKHQIRFLDGIEQLLESQFERAMIDIPIGLPQRGNRKCDEAARELLAPHQPRVFLGARRWILDCSSQAEATRIARSLGQAGVSAQLFCLSAKIREVDAFVCEAGQSRILETHPELVFWRLNGRKGLLGKKTKQGRAQRRAILEREGFDKIGVWLKARLGTGAKPDDVLDACACAIAARDAKHRVPNGSASFDEKGLRMEINY